MKRYLYGAALLCLLGAGICLMQWARLPKTVGDALQDVQEDDPAAKKEVEGLAVGDPVAENWLRGAEGFVVGVAVFAVWAKKAR